MKVKELREILKGCNPDLEVVLYAENEHSLFTEIKNVTVGHKDNECVFTGFEDEEEIIEEDFSITGNVEDCIILE